ncbi:hypothetical protein ACVWWG_005465 [Bradyrhizobium sp. LB7.2]|uniref:hypothetical protein n=1 Tax=Bradyrhizobium sp. LB14.3 TaxID=3156328 RepID=UPI0033971DB8
MGTEPEQPINMTADECDELADALTEAAVAPPAGQKRLEITHLAHCYRRLARMKRLVARNVI